MENNRTEEYTRNSYMKSYMENREKEIEDVFEKFISTCMLLTNKLENQVMTTADLKDKRDKIQTLWNDSLGLIVHSSKDKIGEATKMYDETIKTINDTMDILLLTSMLYKIKNMEHKTITQEEMESFNRGYSEKRVYEQELEKGTDAHALEGYNHKKFEVLSKIQSKIVFDKNGPRFMNAEEMKNMEYHGPFSTRK